MKTLIVVASTLALSLSLAGCGGATTPLKPADAVPLVDAAAKECELHVDASVAAMCSLGDAILDGLLRLAPPPSGTTVSAPPKTRADKVNAIAKAAAK